MGIYFFPLLYEEIIVKKERTKKATETWRVRPELKILWLTLAFFLCLFICKMKVPTNGKLYLAVTFGQALC